MSENDKTDSPKIPDFSGPVDNQSYNRQDLARQPPKQPPKQEERQRQRPPSPPAQKAPAQYFLNATKVDQSVIGPDGSSRCVPPQSYIHRSQFGNPGLPEKCQKVGIFVGVRNLDHIRLSGSRDRKLIIGGELNNAKGHYHRSAA